MENITQSSLEVVERFVHDTRSRKADMFELNGVWELKLINKFGRVIDRRVKHNVICQVGKNQILAASGAEYLNQFAYIAIGTNSLGVTGATNASPIVITVPAYGLANGQPVTISGVTGNTNANGSNYAKTTSYTSTTFGLYSDSGLTTPVAGSGAYVSGGILTVTPNVIDIALLNQLAISTLITPTNPSAPVLQFQYPFGAGTGTGSIAECGLFDAASSGHILSHLSFGVITKGSSDSLQVTYQLS